MIRKEVGVFLQTVEQENSQGGPHMWGRNDGHEQQAQG